MRIRNHRLFDGDDRPVEFIRKAWRGRDTAPVVGAICGSDQPQAGREFPERRENPFRDRLRRSLLQKDAV